MNRLTNLVVATLVAAQAAFAYHLDPTGTRTHLSGVANGSSRTNVLRYDPLYRLTNETITAAGGGTISYRYDAVGNRTNRTSGVSGLTNQAFTFNTNDCLTTDVYDSNGSTRTNGANTFFYDVENRLTNATVSGTAVTYTYNADGIRVSKTSAGTTTLYLVDSRNPSGYAQVLEEISVSGGTTNLAKVFTYGHDLIAQRTVSSGVRNFYGYDGSGNTRYLTGTSAAISDTYIYDAYGTLLTSTGSTANDYLFAGEQYDSTLALYFLRARYLNTGTGRFWTRDSFAGNNEDPVSLHRYLYANADPVNRIDPSGHFSTVESISVTGNQAAIASLQQAVIAEFQRRVVRTLAFKAGAYAILAGTATTYIGGVVLVVSHSSTSDEEVNEEIVEQIERAKRERKLITFFHYTDKNLAQLAGGLFADSYGAFRGNMYYYEARQRLGVANQDFAYPVDVNPLVTPILPEGRTGGGYGFGGEPQVRFPAGTPPGSVRPGIPTPR